MSQEQLLQNTDILEDIMFFVLSEEKVYLMLFHSDMKTNTLSPLKSKLFKNISENDAQVYTFSFNDLFSYWFRITQQVGKLYWLFFGSVNWSASLTGYHANKYAI